MKKFIAIAIVPLMVFLAACGGSTETKKSDDSSVKMAAVSDEKPTFDGSWVLVEKIPYSWLQIEKLRGAVLRATVKDGNILIEWYRADSDWSSTYWSGTFPSDGTSLVTSQGDTKAMAQSVFASDSNSKTFTYANDQFEFKLMTYGEAHTVHLKRK